MTPQPSYTLYDEIMQEVRLIMKEEGVDEHTATTIRNEKERKKLALYRSKRSPAQKLTNKKRKVYKEMEV